METTSCIMEERHRNTR